MGIDHTAVDWKQLRDPSSGDLTDARLQLHWAVQIVAAVGDRMVDPLPDFSHSSLTWLAGRGVLAGMPVSGPTSFQAAIGLAGLGIELLDREGDSIESISLDGMTMAEAFDRLNAAIRSLDGFESAARLDFSGGEIPTHPVGEGRTFSLEEPAAFEELERWFSNSDGILQLVQGEQPNASPVRCWPHHFDIATLISLDPGLDSETARTVGVGMAPGDGSYPEPYWYVTPWPYPENPELPDLDGDGLWHQEGWLGAVLTASGLVGAGSAAAQAEQAAAFLNSSISACRAILGAHE
jgi:hypothetical protein